VAHPVAYGNGDSFPSGHALGSVVCYGALFLVFLPVTRGIRRRVLTAVSVTLIAAIERGALPPRPPASGPAPAEGKRSQRRDHARDSLALATR
jgi:hypothetical protein